MHLPVSWYCFGPAQPHIMTVQPNQKMNKADRRAVEALQWIDTSHVLLQGQQGSTPQTLHLPSVSEGTTSILSCTSALVRCTTSGGPRRHAHCLKTPEPAPRCLPGSVSSPHLKLLLPPYAPAPEVSNVDIQVDPPRFPVSEFSDKGVQVDLPRVLVPEFSDKGFQVDLPYVPVPEFSIEDVRLVSQSPELFHESQSSEPLSRPPMFLYRHRQPPGKVLCGFSMHCCQPPRILHRRRWLPEVCASSGRPPSHQSVA
ncbi:hypothetical protein GOODEAATRI_024822 [Goodea atripinnis]|uniref:Uncharacterized protein n=1 Tax=Goodea atripinnis TaxID=208336 RepID=A0ABV0MUW4_9TELE